MCVMDGDCDKPTNNMVTESIPDVVSTEDIKLSSEEHDILPVVGTEEDVKDGKCPSPELPVKAEAETAIAEPVVNGLSKEADKCESEDTVEQLSVDDSRVDDERTNSLAVNAEEEAVTKEVVKEAKESGSGACSDDDDRNSIASSQGRKRTALGEGEVEGSSSESENGGGKRMRLEADDGEDERERLVREYVEGNTENPRELSKAAEKLQKEIGALGELLRTKELEWNSILRLRKLKEEMLERLLRRRRLISVVDNCMDSKENLPQQPPFTKSENHSPMKTVTGSPVPPSHTNGGGGMMMVPMYSRPPHPMMRGPRIQRPILPKPPMDHNSVGEGRQGAIRDVKSIIAEYSCRSRHPENVPRRGRRVRQPETHTRPMLDHQPMVSSTRISGSPALMSMANMALGSGSHVRENPPGPSYMCQDSSRPSSADSSRNGPPLEGPPLCFKDALVQFAKLSQPPKQPPPPPPPYPEVTLHPVSPPPPTHHPTSLLHGILTKPTPGPAPSSGATNFSPTLARLLTAPERSHPPPPHIPTNTPPSNFRPPVSRVNITDILSSSKKTRNEITITPVSGNNKTKEDLVFMGDEDEEGDGDRLVIDESRDGVSNSELPEKVPECQGCHQRAAQFVCAGCGNQWYCSRECQVAAWEEHSEVCTG